MGTAYEQEEKTVVRSRRSALPTVQDCLISNLAGAKTAYRDAAGELAKLASKVRASDRKHMNPAAARDTARVQNELLARFGLKANELQALMACGKINHWDATDPVKYEPRP
jgi:hypothetical protein